MPDLSLTHALIGVAVIWALVLLLIAGLMRASSKPRPKAPETSYTRAVSSNRKSGRSPR